MNPHELAIRLVALRQLSLEPRPEAKSVRRTYRDELALWGAWLQARPDALEGLLNVLVSEIATSRRELGLPVLDAPAWSVPADPPVDLAASGLLPADIVALVDRMAAMVAAAVGPEQWELEVTVGDSAATARPAEDGAA